MPRIATEQGAAISEPCKIVRPRGQDGGGKRSCRPCPGERRRSLDRTCCEAEIVWSSRGAGTESRRVSLQEDDEERRRRQVRKSPWRPRVISPPSLGGRPGRRPILGGGGLRPEGWPRAAQGEVRASGTRTTCNTGTLCRASHSGQSQLNGLVAGVRLMEGILSLSLGLPGLYGAAAWLLGPQPPICGLAPRPVGEDRGPPGAGLAQDLSAPGWTVTAGAGTGNSDRRGCGACERSTGLPGALCRATTEGNWWSVRGVRSLFVAAASLGHLDSCRARPSGRCSTPGGVCSLRGGPASGGLPYGHPN
ncbi:hypothetical protein NDU88_006668 [Pleurodeles waltl]|uniref:Uncharacterized protein n=1 Tax=Pleurodeles waltl TaxID=8319 RepID=A0AAV7NTR9_PLEWA|nr:hypothetical protein NDU88_006668 [Pleurodeles waltl]